MKLVRYVILVLAIFASSVIGSCFAETNVIASFDKRTISFGERVTLTVRIDDIDRNVPAPALEGNGDFSVRFAGRKEKFNYLNGKSIRSISYLYEIEPLRKGDLFFPAFNVAIGQNVFQNPATKLTVFDGGQKNQPTALVPLVSPPLLPQQRKNTITTSSASVISQQTPTMNGNSNVLFVKAEVDKVVAYPNEQITLTYAIYTRTDLRYEGFHEEPVLKGFWVEDLTPKEKPPMEETYINGKQYARVYVREIALFASQSGTYVIDPGIVKASVKQLTSGDDLFDAFFQDRFFGNTVAGKREDRFLYADPITITVKSFPTRKKPKNFNGIAGEYRLWIDLEETNVPRETPVTLTMIVEGKGPVETISAPNFPVIADMKVYHRDTDVVVTKNKGIVGGKKTFTYMLIPERVGEYIIPVVEFPYFNTKYDTYMYLKNGPFALTVNPGEKSEMVEAASDKLLPRDYPHPEVMGLINPAADVSVSSLASMIKTFVYIVVVLFTMTAILLLIQAYRSRYDFDIALKRKKLAIRKCSKRLKKAQLERNDVGSANYCLHALYGYIADINNSPENEMTTIMARGILRQHGVTEALITYFTDACDECNRLQFGREQKTIKEKTQWILAMQDIVKNIHGVLA